MHTDGNAIGGLLQEILIGEHRLYRGAGMVLRCPSCGDLAACIVVLPERYEISLRGMWNIGRMLTEASGTPARAVGR
jgi:hypothetical protein